jgi:hypothetical protein
MSKKRILLLAATMICVSFIMWAGTAHATTTAKAQVLDAGISTDGVIYANLHITFVAGANEAGLVVGQDYIMYVPSTSNRSKEMLATILTAASFGLYMQNNVISSTQGGVTVYEMENAYVVTNAGCASDYINCFQSQ